MNKYKWVLILVNLLILIGLFHFSVSKKETLLTDGTLILLELAPVDPRSLMQGDFMRLNYAISNNLRSDSIPKRGFCVVELDKNGVGKKVRIQSAPSPKSATEYLIEYTSASWRGINIGAESYFFQEGQAEKYEEAKYGGLKIDDQGNSLLIGLYSKERELIQ